MTHLRTNQDYRSGRAGVEAETTLHGLFNTPVRLAIVQGVVADYNVPLFRRLARFERFCTRLFQMTFSLPPALLGVREVVELKDIDVDHVQRSRFVWQIGRRLSAPLPSIRLVKKIVAWHPDCILIDGLSSFGNALFLLATRRVHHAQFVWWSLGAIPGRKTSLRSRCGDFLQYWCTRRCAAVIAYSTHGACFFESLGVPANRVFVANNTIDEQAVFKSIQRCVPLLSGLREQLQIGSHPVVIFSGTINQGKRVDLLLQAFARLLNRSPSLAPILLIIGDGPKFGEMRDLAHQLGISGHVLFVGRQHEMASAYFLLSQFAVLPGLGGLAINHAFAHGLPVICGPADGCELDLVRNGETGIYLPKMNAENLCEAMNSLFANPNLCAKLGANARRLVSTEISLENYARRIEHVVLNVCLGTQIVQDPAAHVLLRGDAPNSHH